MKTRSQGGGFFHEDVFRAAAELREKFEKQYLFDARLGLAPPLSQLQTRVLRHAGLVLMKAFRAHIFGFSLLALALVDWPGLTYQRRLGFSLKIGRYP
jgi:hypothetical protein